MLSTPYGLYNLAARDIFERLEKGVSAHVSFYEIYQGQLYDLLNARRRLYAREDGNKQVCIVGLTEHVCTGEEDLQEVFNRGEATRSTGSTHANADSSRSHAILQIVLKQANKPTGGKFSFIDLAGSERGADRGEADRQTR